MRPALGLVHQRDGAGTAAAEEDRVDRHARGLTLVHAGEAVLVEHRAVLRRSREAAVLVCGDVTGGLDLGLGHARLRTHAALVIRADIALVALPVNALGRRVDAHVFPPDVTVGREHDVREDRVLLAGEERVRVGVHGRTRRNAEEAVLGVDGVELAIGARLEPRDIVADRLELPARELREHHREVRLAAGGRKGRRDVILLLLRRGEREDEHVLGHPTVVLRELGRNAEREALLAEEGVAAVTRTERPDLAVLGELRDVLVVDRLGAGPRDVLLALLERSADGVDARDEVNALVEVLHDGIARTGHDVHVDDDVRGVRDLDAVLGDRVADRAHGERDDVHRAALHAALVLLEHLLLHGVRIPPMVGRAGVDLVLRADEGAALDARDVGLVRTSEVAARTLLLVELDELAVLDHHLANRGVLLLVTLDDNNVVRGANLDPLINPRLNLGVLELRRLSHCVSP